MALCIPTLEPYALRWLCRQRGPLAVLLIHPEALQKLPPRSGLSGIVLLVLIRVPTLGVKLLIPSTQVGAKGLTEIIEPSNELQFPAMFPAPYPLKDAPAAMPNYPQTLQLVPTRLAKCPQALPSFPMTLLPPRTPRSVRKCFPLPSVRKARSRRRVKEPLNILLH